MSASCVNTRSKEFKDTVKRLDIHKDQLEFIVHDYQSVEGNEDKFPPDSFIRSKLVGTRMTNASKNQALLWKNRYSKPMFVSTLKGLNKLINEITKFFPRNSIVAQRLANGNYKVSVAKPITKKNGYFQRSKDRVENKEKIERKFKEKVTTPEFKQRYEDTISRVKQLIESRIYKPFENESKEEFASRVQKLLEVLVGTDAIKSFVDSYYKVQLPDGSYKFKVNFKNLQTIIDERTKALDRWNDEQLSTEALRVQQGAKGSDLYYINPKKVPALKEQVRKKSNTQTLESIEEAFNFLESLENNPDMNQYVDTCIRWLKNDSIRLPEDHEKIIEAFNSARKHRIDTQSFKNAEDLLVYAASLNVEKEAIPIKPSEVKEFHYNRSVESEHGIIEIYDVDDNENGQKAVAQALADTAPKDGNKEPVFGSPWCLSTFNYHRDTGKITLTNSAKEFWKQYSKGKRQIAFLNGTPIAFNSTDQGYVDAWWDFNDYTPYSNVLDIDFKAIKNRYETAARKIKSVILNNISMDYDGSGVTSMFRKEEGGYIQYTSNYFTKEVEFNNWYLEGSAKFQIVRRYNQTVGPHTRFSTTLPDIHRAGELTINIYKDEIEVHVSIPGISDRNIGTIIESPVNENQNGINISVVNDEVTVLTADEIKYINKLGKNLNIRSNIEDYNSNLVELINKIQERINKSILKQREELEAKRKEEKRLEKEKEEKAGKKLLNLQPQNPTSQNAVEAITTQTVQQELSGVSEYLDSALESETNVENVEQEYSTGEIDESDLNEIGEVVENSNTTDTDVSTDTILSALDYLKEDAMGRDYARHIDAPFKKELDAILKDILSKYHFDIVEADLREVFGEDTLGALDMLQKIIYLSSNGDRNAITMPEEFSHAFIELMGGVYRRNRTKYPESRLYSELRDLVENTAIYRATYAQYKDIYKRADGTIDLPKIKKEALGKALATSIANRYEAKTASEKSFFTKLARWFKNVLNYFKFKLGKVDELTYRLDKIADSILNGSYAVKYLDKVKDSREYKLVTFKDTLEQQTTKDGGKALELLQKFNSLGAKLTGSLAYRVQGTVYRKSVDALHDMDFIVPASEHKIFNNTIYVNMRGNINNEHYVSMLVNSDYFKKVKEQVPNLDLLAVYPSTNGVNPVTALVANCIICEDANLVQKFKNLEGNYNKRLESLTQEERDKIYLVDLFLRQDSNVETFKEQSTNLEMADYTEAFNSKLSLGRAKDIFDYQNYDIAQKKFKVNSSSVMYQKSLDRKEGKKDMSNIEANIKELTPKIGKEAINTTIETLNSDNSELLPAEKKSITSILGDKKPRVLIASETTDPVWHYTKIEKMVNEEVKKDPKDRKFHMLYLITKHDGLPLKSLLSLKIPKFVHFSITSLGGTKYEPGVMKADDLLDRIEAFIKQGDLNPNLVTIRIDPIIPGVNDNPNTIRHIMERARSMGIRQFKFSVLDSYGSSEGTARDRYIVQKMSELGYNWSDFYNMYGDKVSFNAKDGVVENIYRMMDNLAEELDVYINTCGEAPKHIQGLKRIRFNVGCVNVNAMNAAMGTNDIAHIKGNQRAECSCYGFKQDALRYDDACASSCVYCYAKHNADSTHNYYNEDGTLKNDIYTQTSEQQDTTKQDNTNKQDTTEQDKNKKFMEERKSINDQVEALVKSDNLTNAEVGQIAEAAAFFISDLITDLQEGKKDPFNLGVDYTSMTRVQIAMTVGARRLIDYTKNYFKCNDEIDLDKAEAMDEAIENWDGIIFKGFAAFKGIEKFTIQCTSEDNILEVTEDDLFSDSDDFNTSHDEQDILENGESLQEHYQVNARSIDIMTDMSDKVRQALIQCYLIDDNGNKIISPFGFVERMNTRKAINSILRWCQGSLTLEEMIEALKKKADKNKWVNSLISRLEDPSQHELQSQFFTSFFKHLQLFYKVKDDNGKFSSIPVNSHPALSEATTNIKTLYKIGEHPLLSPGEINRTAASQLNSLVNGLLSTYNKTDAINSSQVHDIAERLSAIYNLLGYKMIPDLLVPIINNTSVHSIAKNLNYLNKSIQNNLNNKDYDPFDYHNKDSITGNLSKVLQLYTDTLEDTYPSSFFDDGKMYQSYITPSYTTKLFQKFRFLDDESFEEFMENEFGQYEWFKNSNGWRNSLLEWLSLGNNRKEFKHKVQLSFNGHTYMKGMDDLEYAMSLLSEYFSDIKDNKDKATWFRMPMLSNKPSSEFIHMIAYRDPATYQETIVDKLKMIFDQELTRIQTVKLRNYEGTDPRFINNFDKNGKKFCFLDFLNEANSELTRLVEDKTDGKKVDEAKLNKLAKEEITNYLNSRTESILEGWKAKGILDNTNRIPHLSGKSESQVREELKNFIWNDFLASCNLMQLLVTDIAYYKDAEDLQKRMAQVHSPGIRGNYQVIYKGVKISDGKHRIIVIDDLKDVLSNVIDNLTEVFNRKIALADDTNKEAFRVLKDYLVGKDGVFRKINVTDGQAFSCPTSYRKKALIFGKWGEAAENVYNKLLKGEADIKDLQTTFQPLKPLIYSQIGKNSGVKTPGLMSRLKLPIQVKDSEYLLIMADALLQGENTSRPNLLRAIYEVMEESHKDGDAYSEKGIDSVVFDSTIKSGLTGVIEMSKYSENKNGESLAKAALRAAIYNYEVEENKEEGNNKQYNKYRSTGYNETFVHEIPFEDFCIQQEMPSHFKDHEQPQGSQGRYINMSELENFDMDGNPVIYNVDGKEYSANEIKEELENLTARNIEEDIQALANELNLPYINDETGISDEDYAGLLDRCTKKNRNIALSKILVREVQSSNRYGVDMLMAVTLDKNGEFKIPLDDPIQSKRIEQLLNSFIKNHINKQYIKGGPAVQVSNFGTSHRLSIKFKDKEGKLLDSKEEWEAKNKNTNKKPAVEEVEDAGGLAYIKNSTHSVVGDVFWEKQGNFIRALTKAAENVGMKDTGVSYSRTQNSTSSYFTNADFDEFKAQVDEAINQAKASGKTIVIPEDGIGTGKAMLKETAPKLFNYLQSELAKLKALNEDNYENYVANNQAGVAYYECYVSAYTNDLFKYFMDKDGNVDIGMIEMLNPDLLKMIGYRIPTEDRYSMAPLKIVGILPKEAGDCIMLPYEITALSGSDFDIDKLYLMLKDLLIQTTDGLPMGTDRNSPEAIEYLKKHRQELKNHIISSINLTPKVSKEEADRIAKEVESTYNLDNREDLKKKYESEVNKIEERAEQAREKFDNLADRINELKDKEEEEGLSEEEEKELDQSQKKYKKFIDQIDRSEERDKAKAERRYNLKLQKLEEIKLTDEFNRRYDRYVKAKLNERVERFLREDLYNNSKYDDALMREMRKAYVKFMFRTMVPSVRAERNNKIVAMNYEILTHSTTADKLLNPGNFDALKSIGYRIEALRMGNDWEALSSMSISELKDIVKTNKNLAFLDTQIQFYKQNSAAGTILGAFAVERLAHAVIESGNPEETKDDNGNIVKNKTSYYLAIDRVCTPFTICGMEFKGDMPIDAKYNLDGELIGKILGSLVNSAADAVKDPILNLMNINSLTCNVLTTLLRLRMSPENAALFLSHPAISEVLDRFNAKKLKGEYPKLQDIAKSMLKEALNKFGDKLGSSTSTEDLTKEELIKGIKGTDTNKLKTTIKVLSDFIRVIQLSNAMRLITFATRFNSISTAVGPTIVDNLMTMHKINNYSITEDNLNDPDAVFFDANSAIVDADREVVGNEGERRLVGIDRIFEDHPILKKFSKGYEVASLLFAGKVMSSDGFSELLDLARSIGLMDTILSDRKILTNLGDFYKSYLAIMNGVVNPAHMSYYIKEFPKYFMREGFKDRYKDNLFIQSITLSMDKSLPVLTIDTSGLDQTDKDRLSDGWADLYKQNKKLALNLFEYCFFRGGIGFSPKTFMNLLPVVIKEQMIEYRDTFNNLPNSSDMAPYRSLIMDQWIRHNWTNDRLVPRIDTKNNKDLGIDTSAITINNIDDARPPVKVRVIDNFEDYEKVKYLKLKVTTNETTLNKAREKVQRSKTKDVLLRQSNSNPLLYEVIEPLGANNSYMELATNNIGNAATITKTPVVESSRVVDQSVDLTNDKDLINNASPEELATDSNTSIDSPSLEDEVRNFLMATSAYKTPEAADAYAKHAKGFNDSQRNKVREFMDKQLRKMYPELNNKEVQDKVEKYEQSLCGSKK